MEIKELNKVKESKMSLEVLVLESVGSCVGTDGMIHPLNIDGTPDMNEGMSGHYKETSEEFLNNLSFGDATALNAWVYDHCGDEYTYFVDYDKGSK